MSAVGSLSPGKASHCPRFVLAERHFALRYRCAMTMEQYGSINMFKYAHRKPQAF